MSEQRCEMWTVSGRRELGAETEQGTQEAGMMEGGLSPTRKLSLPTLLPQNGVSAEVLIRADTSPVPFPSTSQGRMPSGSRGTTTWQTTLSVQSYLLEGLRLMPPPLSRPLLTYQHSLFSLGGRNKLAAAHPESPGPDLAETSIWKYLSSEWMGLWRHQGD